MFLGQISFATLTNYSHLGAANEPGAFARYTRADSAIKC